MRHIPHAGHARQLESEVFDGQRLGQAENQSAPKVGAGGFMFTTAKHDIFVVQSVERQMRPHAGCRVDPPNVEILGAT